MNTLLFAVAVAATNTFVSADMPTIVVEASRLNCTSLEMPQRVRTISAQEIAASGESSVVELLRKRAPEVQITGMGGGNPATQNLSIGGYGENGFGRTLILVDGERINNPDMRAPNLSQINLGSIKKIEILSGPQTVLHGDVASGGLINIITEPEDYDSHGYAEVRGGSFNSFGASLGYSGGDSESGTQYWANGSWDTSDGYRDNSGYTIYNANGGIKETFANGSYLRASAFYNYADYDLPRSLAKSVWRHKRKWSIQKAAKYAEEKTDYFKPETYGFNLTGYGVINDENAIRLTTTISRRYTKSGTFGNGSYADYDYTTWQYLGVMDYVWSSLFTYDIYSFGIKPEWINTSDIFGLENEFILGSSFAYDRLKEESSCPTYYHPLYNAPSYVSPYDSRATIDRLTMGYFAQDTLHITEEVAIQGGARYERAWNRNTAAERARRNDNLGAFEGAILYTPMEDLKTFVRVTRFYRNPFLDENPYNGGAKALKILRPETGWHTAIGGEYRFAKDFTFAADGFFSRTKHEVFYNPFYAYNSDWFSWTADNVNSPNPVNRYGFNLSAGWERDKFAGIYLGYSFVHATFDGGQYDDKKVPLVPESTVSINGRVWIWDDCYVFGGYRHQTKMYTISDFNNDGLYAGKSSFAPAYGIFHLGLTYEPTFVGWIRGWKASVVCNNLFDAKYCTYASYGKNFWPADGRSVMATLRYEF